MAQKKEEREHGGGGRIKKDLLTILNFSFTDIQLIPLFFKSLELIYLDVR